jgi:Phosphotransferase enzyme family
VLPPPLPPDLAGVEITPLGAGFDCAAWLVGGRVVVKSPLHDDAARALSREARVLAVARPGLRLAIPDLTLDPGPPPLSRHSLVPGVQPLAPIYDALGDAARDRFAQTLARFHADCHALPPEALAASARLIEDWAALPYDPLGNVWGHFDAHGWNMAFDPTTEILNGIYDFGDSGFGPLHRDLVYSALISPDLTCRLARHYRAETGRPVSLNRLRILSGAHRLWELADPQADRPFQTAAFLRWAAFPWPEET